MGGDMRPRRVCVRDAGGFAARQVVGGLALASEGSAVKLLAPGMLQARPASAPVSLSTNVG